MTRAPSSTVYDYDFMDQIGVGSYGCVYRAKHKVTNSMVAVKVMKKKGRKSSENNHWQEYKTMKRLSNHPNIVRLYEGFTGPTKELYFVMEFMNGGNLYQYLKEQRVSRKIPTESQVRHILRQILDALASMHDQGYFHRDLKPENLLVETNQEHPTQLTIKLADFGLARELKSKAPYTDYVSTRWYRSPEVLLKASVYSSPVDIWAVGVIMAELYTLFPLFPGQSEIDQLYRICEILGSPGTNIISRKKNKIRSNGFSRKKSDISLYSSTNMATTSTGILNERTCTLGEGGEWKEGAKLAQKIGFQFPQVEPKGLSSVLPKASNLMIDLLRRLLLFEPEKRLCARDALCHPFFIDSTSTPTIRLTSEQLDIPASSTSPCQTPRIPSMVTISTSSPLGTNLTHMNSLPHIPLSSMDTSMTLNDDSIPSKQSDYDISPQPQRHRHSTSIVDLKLLDSSVALDHQLACPISPLNDSFENVIDQVMFDLRDDDNNDEDNKSSDISNVTSNIPYRFGCSDELPLEEDANSTDSQHYKRDGHIRHDSLDFLNALDTPPLPQTIRPSFSSPLQHDKRTQNQRIPVNDHYTLHHSHHHVTNNKKKSTTSISQFFGLRKKTRSAEQQTTMPGLNQARQDRPLSKNMHCTPAIMTNTDLSSKSPISNGVPRTESFPSFLMKHFTSSSTSSRPNLTQTANAPKLLVDQSKKEHTSLQRRSSSMSILNIYYDGEYSKKKSNSKGNFWTKKHTHNNIHDTLLAPSPRTTSLSTSIPSILK